MAKNINKELVKVGFKDLGIIERPNLAVLRGTRMPAVLVETGFINTEADNDLFDERNDDIAKGIADAIAKTVSGAAGTGVDVISEDIVETKPDIKNVAEKFSVQVGAFRHYENADNLAKTYKNSVMTVLLKRADILIMSATDGMTSMWM